jgi:DNA repair exonuclease SbcCD nuclease subunit
MPRFLHIADIHLGFDRYDNRERTKDFYLAFADVLQRYAIAPQVDFVLIAGDLFEHRMIQPAVLSQAKDGLEQLRAAEIPVLAIEGNHDNRPYGTRTSWLRYLADDGLLMLLEPEVGQAGVLEFAPWDGLYGGYVDLDCGVRVLGSAWYGSSAPSAIASLAGAMERLPTYAGPTIMMFHHGLEGQIARYQGALRYNDLLPLRQAGVDYLALGHIHKNYQVDNWIFNPGSLEANSIEEAGLQRGAYLVDITADTIQAQLHQDYYQRPIVRCQLTAKGHETQAELESQAIQTIEAAIAARTLQPDVQPIVELRLEGSVGFDRLDLDVRELQQHLQTLSNALIFLLKYNVDAIAYATPLTEEANRLQIEQAVFTDLLAAHNSYKKNAPQLAQVLLDLKDRHLAGQSEEDLYAYLETLFP